jgi:hypothetical protein
MTNGLAILGGYSILFVLVALLVACLWRRSRCDEPSND